MNRSAPGLAIELPSWTGESAGLWRHGSCCCASPGVAFLFSLLGEAAMPRGDKSSYTDKQKRKAEHIEEGYKNRGVSEKEAERRAWATVNASDKGGKKSGSGRGKKSNSAPSKKGGKKGGEASARRSKAARSASAKKAAATRKRNAAKS
jgi:hypothetical protein